MFNIYDDAPKRARPHDRRKNRPQTHTMTMPRLFAGALALAVLAGCPAASQAQDVCNDNEKVRSYPLGPGARPGAGRPRHHATVATPRTPRRTNPRAHPPLSYEDTPAPLSFAHMFTRPYTHTHTATEPVE